VSQNLNRGLLISADAPSRQIFICSPDTCKCLPLWKISTT